MDLNTIQNKIREVRAIRGFTIDPLQIYTLLNEEVGGIGSELKKAWSQNYNDFSVYSLSEEISDAMVCLMALANCYEINIENSINEKFFKKDNARNWNTAGSSEIGTNYYGKLIEIIKKSEIFNKLISELEETNYPNAYICAGFIQQIVYNFANGYDLHKNIKDIDIIYFDQQENKEYDKLVSELLYKGIDKRIEIDIKNQAFVHIWYEEKYGYAIDPYKSIYEAIDSFPTTSTSIGIRKEKEEYRIYSSFGLDDLFNMILRPNKRQITKEIYDKKKNRIKKFWPKVRVVEWDA